MCSHFRRSKIFYCVDHFNGQYNVGIIISRFSQVREWLGIDRCRLSAHLTDAPRCGDMALESLLVSSVF